MGCAMTQFTPTNRRGLCCLMLVATLSTWLTSNHARGHGVLIGHNGAGQLSLHIESPQPLAIPLSIFPNMPGWAGAEPGIAAADVDEPGENLFVLSANSNIQFELVSFDPGIQIVTDHIWVAGETYLFGPPAFDYHLVFNIPAGDAGETYEVQFKVRDLAGIYADSPVATLVFSAGGACHCFGDFDDDHARTGRDIESFVHCMMHAEPGHPLEAHCGCADLNGDGALTGTDMGMFIDDLLHHGSCH